MLKRLAVLSILGLGAQAAWAVPSLINFQGKLLDPATNNPKNGSFTMNFRIYDAAASGNTLWGPEPQTVNVTNGVFSVQLGAVVALSTAPFAGDSAYLGITISGDAGGEMAPRQRLVGAPYAFSAAHLAHDKDIGVYPGASSTASTFTSAGNLLVAYGITATTGTFTATGGAVYSLTTSSGISVLAGSVDAAGRVSAQTFTGDGSELTGVSPDVSISSANAGVVLTINTDTVIVSTSVVLARPDRAVLIYAMFSVSRSGNNTPSVVSRIYRSANAACSSANTVLYSKTDSRPNVAGSVVTYPIMTVDKPNTTAQTYYCLVVFDTAADTVSNATIVTMTASP